MHDKPSSTYRPSITERESRSATTIGDDNRFIFGKKMNQFNCSRSHVKCVWTSNVFKESKTGITTMKSVH